MADRGVESRRSNTHLRGNLPSRRRIWSPFNRLLGVSSHNIPVTHGHTDPHAHTTRWISRTITRTRSTVHTSDKARLTSIAISVPPCGECSSRFMSVNHFMYLPTVTNPKKQSLYPDGGPYRHQNSIIILFIGPLPTFPENFTQICSEVFAQSC